MKKIILLLLITLLFTTTANADKYNRKHWMPKGWAVHSNGINTRGKILSRDGHIDNRTGDRYWICPYTGKRFDKASDIDIDHIVSLKEAHVSGGDAWSLKKKNAFANDFNNLLAVYDKENRKKSSKSAEKWQPPLKSYRKKFAKRYRMVKKKWGLRISKKENKALRRMER